MLFFLFVSQILGQSQWTGLYVLQSPCPSNCCCVSSAYAFQKTTSVSLQEIRLSNTSGCSGQTSYVDTTFQLSSIVSNTGAFQFFGQNVNLTLLKGGVTTANTQAPQCNSQLALSPTMSYHWDEQNLSFGSSTTFCFNYIPVRDLATGWMVNATFRSVDNDAYTVRIGGSVSAENCYANDLDCVYSSRSYSGSNFVNTITTSNTSVCSQNSVYESIGVKFICNNAIQSCEIELDDLDIIIKQISGSNQDVISGSNQDVFGQNRKLVRFGSEQEKKKIKLN